MYGAKLRKKVSQVGYLRVNLRALRWRELLAKAPPALWPLVPLTRDGASEEAVHAARDAIEARTDLTEVQQADHLAVLWFVAEAEEVPTRVMREYISERKLMTSTLYQENFEKGEARGEVTHCAKVLIQTLTRWLGALDAAVSARIRAETSFDTLSAWLNEALYLENAEGARRLSEKIGNAARS